MSTLELKKKRKRKSHKEETSVECGIKRIKTEPDQLFDTPCKEDRTKLKKHKKKKKHKKDKRNKSQDIPPSKPLHSNDESHQSPTKTEPEEYRDRPSHHLKQHTKFIEDLKQVGVDCPEADETTEDQYSELHSGSYKTQNSDMSRKHGRWNVQEMKILKTNLQQFKKLNKIQDMEKWIKDSDRTEHKGFYTFVAKNINRSSFAIYRRVKRLINEENYIGRWSQDMNKELLRLHEEHGNQWKIIGQHLGVSSDLCRDHYRILIKHNHSRGAWSANEERCLIQVLAEHGVDSKSDGSIPVDVTWDIIARGVKTRNASQCRRKWTDMLSWQLQGGIEAWDAMDSLKLLEILGGDPNTEDEDDVDWEGLVEEWESARTKYFIRQKWSGLKRLVPHYQFKTYQECLDYLLHHHLPALREKCQNK